MRLLVVVPLVLACSDRDRPEIQPDPQRQHRVIESGAPGRPLPPHQIRADGVGPYKLGERLDVLLGALPSGPRIATFDIRGVPPYWQVVHANILHAEDEDSVVIGGEPGGAASFVAVVGRKVARTDSGVHVGSTRDELTRALGAPVDDVARAHDPRLVVPSGLRNARMILDGDHIAAIIVMTDSAPATSRDTGDCVRPASTGDRVGTCLGSGELMSVEGDEITLRPPDAEKPIASWPVPNLVFAAPLRVDRRDEIVVITRTDEANAKTWSLVAYALDKTKLVKTIDMPLYQLSTTNARWIGADLHDVDLYVELQSRPDAIEVGGLLTTRVGDKIRDVVVISPVPVPRRHGKPATAEASDAGVTGTLPESGSASRSKP